jgi:nucleotide-binding universal stress UspA family protein
LVLGKKSELDEGRAAASRVLRQTVRHATRPVLCVDENDALDSSEGPVLVAYDGSSHAAKSLQIFNTLGLAHGRKIHLVLVAKDSSELHTIDMAAEYLKTFGHEVHSKIRPAGLSIGTEILADARLVGASLIVMGAYGQSPVRELFFGSVTSAILKDSNLPLFLYH